MTTKQTIAILIADADAEDREMAQDALRKVAFPLLPPQGTS
jgi:hypothetical protein